MKPIRITIPRLLWVPSWNIRPRVSALRLVEITLTALLLFWVAEFWGLQQERNAMEASLPPGEVFMNDDARWWLNPLDPDWATHESREDRWLFVTLVGFPPFIFAASSCVAWELASWLRWLMRKSRQRRSPQWEIPKR